MSSISSAHAAAATAAAAAAIPASDGPSSPAATHVYTRVVLIIFKVLTDIKEDCALRLAYENVLCDLVTVSLNNFRLISM
mmetsp:Transcript_18150/g.50855  ORF Transcript_18150/g.50855 Transcript_18150/m.50855 type:complete len:80 (+) Transcript_18150:520-759(+)